MLGARLFSQNGNHQNGMSGGLALVIRPSLRYQNEDIDRILFLKK